MGEVLITNDVDEGTWRNFVERQRHGNVFHTPEMSGVFARAQGHRMSLWAACDPSGSTLALFAPVEVTLVDGPLRPWTSRAIAYGGMLSADDDAGREAAASLLSAYVRQNRRQVLFTELRHLHDASDLGPALRAAGFSHEEHMNYLIRLDRPEGDLWGALSRTAKQRVRSAEKKGVTVEQATAATQADEAYRLLEDVYRRVRVPLASRSLFEAAMSVLHPRGMLRIFTARLGDRIIGARFLLLHKSRIIDWYAGSDRAFASYSPNELLVWSAQRWGQEHGFEVFDFGGAGRPGERYGPREFKAKFGGELVSFGRDVHVDAALRLRLSRTGYGIARRLRSVVRARGGHRLRERQA
jgi:serine/alanine adding enzyme